MTPAPGAARVIRSRRAPGPLPSAGRLHAMTHYIIRRILHAIPLLLMVSVVGFILINLPPGDYLDTYLIRLESEGGTAAEEMVAGLRERFGLDRPLHQQYVRWITSFIRGDMGGVVLPAAPGGRHRAGAATR